MRKLVITALVAATATFGGAMAEAASGWVKKGITLNGRSGPGTNYPVTGTFHACSHLNVVGWQHGWAKVSYNHQYYWVSGQYVRNQACQHYNQHQPAHKPSGGSTYKNY